MKKMQWRGLKILIILFTLLFSSGNLAFAQISNYRLQLADSLFEAKQYTQSIEHYRSILQQKQYSPAMLLKMAYIAEGLNQVGEALYFLNLYYLSTHDKSTLDKMEELAEKHDLAGYSNTEADRVFSLYHNFHLPISAGLAVVIFFLLSVSVFLKRKKQRPLATAVLSIFFTIVLAIHINMGERVSTGIIAHSNTYVMDGPSGGASVNAVLNAGHRVNIIGKKDVWARIEWDGETVYVKESNLLPVAL